MKHLTAKTLGAIALSAMISTAGAATFDFVAMADDNTDANYFGEIGLAELDVTVDGINLKATGTDTTDYASFLLGDYEGNLNNEYAYLDSGTAGLGVCTNLNSTQCNPSSDDNATADEVLSIAFDQEVSLSGLFFRDANHNTFADDTNDDFSLFIDGVFEGIFNYGSPAAALFEGTVFGFSADDYIDGVFRNDGDQFYISSLEASGLDGEEPPEVPVPAAIWLLGSALGGLGFMRRKTAKS